MEAKHTAGPWRQAHVVSAYERKRRVIKDYLVRQCKNASCFSF